MTLRVAIGIDPGTKTGLGAWVVGGDFLRGELVDIHRAGWNEMQAFVVLDALVPAKAEWIAAVEAPWAHIRGRAHDKSRKAFTTAPIYAERYWRQTLDLYARIRAKRADVRFRKPMILRPRPEDWRPRVGVPTAGLGPNEMERRQWLKAEAVRRLRFAHGIEIHQADVAEAAWIAFWLARAAQLPKLGTGPNRKLEEVRFAA